MTDKKPILGCFYPITNKLRDLSHHIPYNSVLGMWVKTPSKTKSGNTVHREHRIYLNLCQALELRHRLDIAIELESERMKGN